MTIYNNEAKKTASVSCMAFYIWTQVLVIILITYKHTPNLSNFDPNSEWA